METERGGTRGGGSERMTEEAEEEKIRMSKTRGSFKRITNWRELRIQCASVSVCIRRQR